MSMKTRTAVAMVGASLAYVLLVLPMGRVRAQDPAVPAAPAAIAAMPAVPAIPAIPAMPAGTRSRERRGAGAGLGQGCVLSDRLQGSGGRGCSAIAFADQACGARWRGFGERTARRQRGLDGVSADSHAALGGHRSDGT